MHSLKTFLALLGWAFCLCSFNKKYINDIVGELFENIKFIKSRVRHDCFNVFWHVNKEDQLNVAFNTSYFLMGGNHQIFFLYCIVFSTICAGK